MSDHAHEWAFFGMGGVEGSGWRCLHCNEPKPTDHDPTPEQEALAEALGPVRVLAEIKMLSAGWDEKSESAVRLALSEIAALAERGYRVSRDGLAMRIESLITIYSDDDNAKTWIEETPLLTRSQVVDDLRQALREAAQLQAGRKEPTK